MKKMFIPLLVIVLFSAIIISCIGSTVSALLNVGVDSQIYTNYYVIDKYAAVTAVGDLYGYVSDSGNIIHASAGTSITSIMSSDDVIATVAVWDNVGGETNSDAHSAIGPANPGVYAYASQHYDPTDGVSEVYGRYYAYMRYEELDSDNIMYGVPLSLSVADIN